MLSISVTFQLQRLKFSIINNTYVPYLHRWIEAWDRERRQYLCESPSKCVATRDDVRFATCPYYDNRSLSDVNTFALLTLSHGFKKNLVFWLIDDFAEIIRLTSTSVTNAYITFCFRFLQEIWTVVGAEVS